MPPAGPRSEELARAKARAIGQQDIRHQSNDAYAFSGLDDLCSLRFDHQERWRQEIEAVTVEDICSVAKRFFADQLAITAIVKPE